MTTAYAKFLNVLAFSAAALGLAAGPALANHDDDWNRGRPDRRIEVFVDAGHDRALETLIERELARENRGVVFVNSPRNADVTVTVNGWTSDVYRLRERDRRANLGYAAVDYDYRVTVRAGRKKVASDRIRGQVVQPLERSGHYYPGAYDAKPGEIAAAVLIGILIGHDGREAYANRLARELVLEAYRRVAGEVADIRLPRGYGPIR